MIQHRSPTRILAVCVILIAVAAMTGLGFWQLDRMTQKERRLASIAQKHTGEPMSLTHALRAVTDPRDTQVQFNGTPDPARIMYLDNRVVEGQVGYDIVVPVRTDVGWVLVNYGWIKAGQRRAYLPEVILAGTSRTFAGVLSKPGQNPMVTETADTAQFPLRIQALDPEFLSTLLKMPLVPYVVVLTRDDPRFKRQWSPVVMPPEKHLGYAIQWFGLAIAAFIVGLLALRKKGSNHDTSA
ncbi:SURF1 family protein [Alteromonas sp. ASW11-19]|uniref:SURF1-like protein n=1 Tax=Alteromonas salexigens TaxID=2982530 RepID=A0ABT2VKH9_9ALTE|nr:SURF1 family protein [Alteromonas salexigens]